MQNTLQLIYEKIISNQVFLSLTSSFIGGIIGGYFSYKATDKSYKYNTQLQDKKRYVYEKATVLSIVEELKTLLEEYQYDFEETYKALNSQEYIEIRYVVSQDYSTIFTENAKDIGLIKDENLRKNIIKTHIHLKRYLEYLILYTTDFQHFEKARSEFIAKVFPNLIDSATSKANTAKEIANIKVCVQKENWSWLNSSLINQTQVMNFIASDEKLIRHLNKSSIDLKNRFYQLKESIPELIELAETIYK